MQVEYGAAPLDLNLTSELCTFLAEMSFHDLSDAAVHEARRGVLDWLGCALAGSQHGTIAKLLNVLTGLSGGGTHSVFGYSTGLGLLDASIANGQMGHVLDFDDTHMDGVILHTSSPVLAALLALAESRPVDGQTFIAAYACGFEAGVRVGKSAPSHHDGGWHLTGTLGTVAAGLACGRQIGLDSQALTYVAGIAATQASGMQQNRGTMCKSFHAGRAASNGILASLLAESGFDSSTEIVEGKRGFARIYSVDSEVDALTANLGADWAICGNGYKPYACGVVQHALIDAMIALSRDHSIDPMEIETVSAQVHPGVIRITGVEAPGTGLKSKFSLTHSAAVAFIDRNASVEQYSDKRATADDVGQLRSKIQVQAIDSFRKDEAAVTITLRSGAQVSTHIEHASGTVDNPMSDGALERKFLDNAGSVISAQAAQQLLESIWQLEKLPDVGVLGQLCRV
jgi:2-methylcitrate dehydratase PrpD